MLLPLMMMISMGPTVVLTLAPSSSPPIPDPADPSTAWYGGNIQYLLNISAIGAASCLLLFLLVKLRSDHRLIPGPSALLAKLLAVYHARIALHCGADAAQFLHIERSSFFVLLALSALALLAALPLNLYAGTAPILDDFARTTITHIPKGSPLLWVHFLLMILVAAVAHFGISRMEETLRITRFQDGSVGVDANSSSSSSSSPLTSSSNSIAIFTIMVQGIPKSLAADKAPFEEYFQHRYPGKVYKVVVPFDLCSLEDLAAKWTTVQNEISWLEARLDARNLNGFNDDDGMTDSSPSSGENLLNLWRRRLKDVWVTFSAKLGFTDEDRLRKLQNSRLVLETKLMDYKEGRAPGAGIAFVVFKDVYTTNKAVKDFRTERKKKKPIGQFFPLMELQLGRSRWRVERAPPASDIYWSHLGLSKLSLTLRRVAVNTCLLLMLLFCSSPLALISAMKSAARIINTEAMDSALSWLDWLEGRGWFASVFLQFLPNVLLFVSMYIIIPSALSYLSKFERHLTVSGEQRAALLKMVCFFLVNLILLRALVESSLESAILGMKRCYLDGEDCKRIEQYMSASFLSRSCLSSLAFLITSSFLGISFDLLAPIPWIKKTMKKFRKNDMLQLVPEQNEDYLPAQNQESSDNLRMPLMSEREDSSGLNGIEGQDLSVYPINRSFHAPKQSFDFAQYYAFNLTIFALTMIYSLFAPLVVPVGAVYFGYRYVVDKYNFLFVYRVRGFPSGNDGKLMDRVLCIMHFCVVLFLLSMLLFFSVRGDSTKLQAIFTLGLLFFKLLPSKTDVIQPSILEGMQTVESFVDGPTDYEIFSQPEFDWDMYQR